MPLPPNPSEHALAGALAALTSRERAVVYLQRAEGLGFDAIARLLQCREADVRAIALRAYARLSRQLLRLPHPEGEP